MRVIITHVNSPAIVVEEYCNSKKKKIVYTKPPYVLHMYVHVS